MVGAPIRDALEHPGGVAGEIQLHIHEPAHEFLERIMRHAAIAVRLDGFRPLDEQVNHLVAKRRVIHRARKPRQAA